MGGSKSKEVLDTNTLQGALQAASKRTNTVIINGNTYTLLQARSKFINNKASTSNPAPGEQEALFQFLNNSGLKGLLVDSYAGSYYTSFGKRKSKSKSKKKRKSRKRRSKRRKSRSKRKSRKRRVRKQRRIRRSSKRRRFSKPVRKAY
jgi:hypothetical protein